MKTIPANEVCVLDPKKDLEKNQKKEKKKKRRKKTVLFRTTPLFSKRLLSVASE